MKVTRRLLSISLNESFFPWLIGAEDRTRWRGVRASRAEEDVEKAMDWRRPKHFEVVLIPSLLIPSSLPLPRLAKSKPLCSLVLFKLSRVVVHLSWTTLSSCAPFLAYFLAHVSTPFVVSDQPWVSQLVRCGRSSSGFCIGVRMWLA